MIKNTHFEAEIRDFLLANGVEDTAQFFFDKLRDLDLSRGEVEWICNLLLYCGHPDLVLQACQQRIEHFKKNPIGTSKKKSSKKAKKIKNKKGSEVLDKDFAAESSEGFCGIPWAHLAEALGMLGKLPEKNLKAIYEGAASAKALHELTRSPYFRFQELQTFREEILQQKKQYAEKRRQEILENADFLATQGLLDEQEKYLALALAIDDAAPEIDERLHSLRQQKASQLVIRKTEDQDEPDLPLFWEQPEGKEEIQFCQDWFEMGQKEPDLKFDFALALFWMGAYKDSANLLRQLPSSPSRDWLLVETLFRGREFVDLLDLLKILESTYSQDPQALLTVVYFRAQSLWELGETVGALESMESLVISEPQFRAAHFLLNRWKAELK